MLTTLSLSNPVSSLHKLLIVLFLSRLYFQHNHRLILQPLNSSRPEIVKKVTSTQTRETMKTISAEASYVLPESVPFNLCSLTIVSFRRTPIHFFLKHYTTTAYHTLQKLLPFAQPDSLCILNSPPAIKSSALAKRKFWPHLGHNDASREWPLNHIMPRLHHEIGHTQNILPRIFSEVWGERFFVGVILCWGGKAKCATPVPSPQLFSPFIILSPSDGDSDSSVCSERRQSGCVAVYVIPPHKNPATGSYILLLLTFPVIRLYFGKYDSVA